MKTILVAESTSAYVREMLLEAAGDRGTLIFAETQDVTPEQVRSADALIGNVSPALLEQAPQLQWVQLVSSGADVYAGRAALKNRFTLTTATGAYGVGIAEYMVCMLLTTKALRFPSARVWYGMKTDSFFGSWKQRMARK